MVIEIDYNFNGVIEPSERKVVNGANVYNQTYYLDDYTQPVRDDGPWPGNITHEDNLTISVYFGTDVKEQTIKVVNVSPEFATRPVLHSSPAGEGLWLITLDAKIKDPGIYDDLLLNAEWADGVSGAITIQPQIQDGEYLTERSVQIQRTVLNPSDLLDDILLLTVTDDDSGVGQYRFEYLDAWKNDDDDNENGVDDRMDSVGGEAEDDLVELSLSSLLSTVPENLLADGHLTVDMSSAIYDYSDSNFFTPSNFWIDAQKTIQLTDLSEIPHSMSTFWVEGLQIGLSTLRFAWQGSSPIIGSFNLLLGEFAVHTTSDAPSPTRVRVKENYWGDDNLAAAGWHETASDVLWEHNDHAWRTVIKGDASLIKQISYWAIPYNNRNAIAYGADLPEGDPTQSLITANATNFANSDKDETVYGEPLPGDWNIVTIVKFTDPNTGATRYRSSQGLHKPLIKVRIEWSQLQDSPLYLNTKYFPEGTHHFVAQGVVGDVIYPEAKVPGADPESTIGVAIFLNPPVPTGFSESLFLSVKDPDNVLNNGLGDVNDLSERTANDNYKGSAKHINPTMDIGAALYLNQPQHDYNGSGNLLEIPIPNNAEVATASMKITEPQPGNNWVLVVHNNQSVVQQVNYRPGIYRPLERNEEAIGTDNQTKVLTAARTLYVENDIMLPPDENTPVFDRGNFNGDEGFTDPLAADYPDDPLPGTNSEQADLLGQANLAVAQRVFRAALIDVVLLSDSFNLHREIPFQHALINRLPLNATHDVISTRSFWTQQLVFVYERNIMGNNDPDKPFGQVVDGDKVTMGEHFYGEDLNVVYTETVRDVTSNNPGYAFVTNPKEVVAAHELGHALMGIHRNEIDERLMTYLAILSSTALDLTQRQLWFAQSVSVPGISLNNNSTSPGEV